MNLMALTVAFLMLLAIMSYSFTKTFIQDRLGYQMYVSWDSCFQVAQKLREQAHLESVREGASQQNQTETKSETQSENRPETQSDSQTKPKHQPAPEKPPKPPRLSFNLARIPNNARLNLWLLLNEQAKPNAEEVSYYELLAALMRHLYESCDFFNQLPHAEYRILDALLAKKEQAKGFKTVDEFSSIDLEDTELQKIFYLMLRGGPSFDDEHPGYLSLLDCIGYETLYPRSGNQKKLNFLFCPQPILESMFKQPSVISELLTIRRRMLEKIITYEKQRPSLSAEDCLTRTQIAHTLVAEFKAAMQHANLDEKKLARCFDFNLGSPGRTLVLRDPKTGVCIREVLK